MSAANYMLCENCGAKVIYLGEDDSRGMAFCNEQCVKQYCEIHLSAVFPPAPNGDQK